MKIKMTGKINENIFNSIGNTFKQTVVGFMIFQALIFLIFAFGRGEYLSIQSNKTPIIFSSATLWFAFIIFALMKYYLINNKFMLLDETKVEFFYKKTGSSKEDALYVFEPKYIKKILFASNAIYITRSKLGAAYLFIESPFQRKIFSIQDLDIYELVSLRELLAKKIPNAQIKTIDCFPVKNLWKEWSR